ncbi:DNA-3-methyladenine glycosylase, partial [Patescibacteria group bacterium]
MRGTVLPPAFFRRDTLTVARELLGMRLMARGPEGSFAQVITEVEAYDGPEDRASHASRGMTARNAPMFGPAGHWYVYLVYGMHWM